jgi:sugar lactone lactonase YvrE
MRERRYSHIRPVLTFVLIVSSALVALSSLSSDRNQNIVELVAGDGTAAFGGDGAVEAELNQPGGLSVNAAGDVFIADSLNHRIRKLTASRSSIQTIAGTGIEGYNGDNQQAVNAWLDLPENTKVDQAGNVYIADTLNHRIRKIDSNGVITTIAGTGTPGYSGDGGTATTATIAGPEGLALDALGNLYIADTFNHAIRIVSPAGVINTIAGTGASGFSGDGGPATSAQLSFPSDVAIDGGGNIFIADSGNNCIREVSSTGIITTFAGTTTAGFHDGPLGSGLLNSPTGIAIDPTGNLFVADFGNNRVRRVTPSGNMSTVAGTMTAGFSGDGGPATSAELSAPAEVGLDGAGNLYIADLGNSRIREVTAGVITTIAGNRNGIAGFNGDGTGAMFAQLQAPTDVAVDAAGNQYIADTGNNRIRKVAISGAISTIAGTGVAGDSGDGGPAIAAAIASPTRVALDTLGNVFFIANNRVREILSNGVLITVAGNSGASSLGDGGPAVLASLNPSAIAIDSAGNLFIGDRYRVRKVDVTGTISTVAGRGFLGTSGDGGPATNAEFGVPSGLAIDTAGNLYITDQTFAAVRKVDTLGIITTYVTALQVQSSLQYALYNPDDLEIDSQGNLFINDQGNARVVEVSPSGSITLVGGTAGTPDVSQFSGGGLGKDETDSLYVADQFHNRVVQVRRITGAAPRVTGISPFSGGQGASISATISGLNLDNVTAVQFSGIGVTATIGTGSTSTTLPVLINIAADAAAGQRSFTVTNGTATSSPFGGFIVTGTGPRPVVNAISPAQGTVGTSFNAIISGLALSGATAVTFGGAGVTATILPGGSSTSLPVSIAISTDAATGSRPFVVTTPNGTSASSLFSVIRPTVTSILPSIGSTGTSLSATIAGNDLSGVTSIAFSGFGVTATVNSGATDTSLPISISISPNADPGVHTFTVSSAIASSLPFDGFTVVQAGYDGIITTVAGNGTTTFGGDSGPATATGLDNATSIAVDPSGNLFIADRNHNRVRKVTPAGIITTVAGNGLIGSSGIGGPATQASFAGLQGIGVDSAGNLFIADGSNNRVLKVDGSGIITQFAGTGAFGSGGDEGPATAAQLNNPLQVKIDSNSNVFIADAVRVRKVTPDGIIHTVAGGGVLSAIASNGLLATSADLSQLADIALDSAGNLFLANNQFIQRVTPSGIIYIVSGVRTGGFGGDGGPAASAKLESPSGLTFDSAGNLFIADRGNVRVRKINPAGIITTVAGNGLWGFSGDGGPATSSTMEYPYGLTVDKDGNLYLADAGTLRIRKVTYSLPVISTITPASASPGSSITAAIRGVALGSATAVSFNGAAVTASILTGGTSTMLPISVTVPPGASPGVLSVSVTTSAGVSQIYTGFEIAAKKRRGQITSQ